MRLPPRKSEEQIKDEMRDKIALRVMECCILKHEEPGIIIKDYNFNEQKALAEYAYELADEMMKARINIDN